MPELLYNHSALAIAIALALGMLAALELAYRLGRPQAASTSEALRSHINSVQASLLGLLALVIGFTFAVALQHYDARSVAVVNEANALGTTWLRTAMLAPPAREEMRALLRDYVDTRVIEGQQALSASRERAMELAESGAMQARLWQLTADIVAKDNNPVSAGLFEQALNDSIDAFGSRNAHLARHVPEIVLWILFATFAVAAAVLGYSAGIAAHRPPLASMLLIALIVALTYLIIDLDRPRRGLIQISQAPMLELQQSLADETTRAARQ
jgi:hypothetical protein